MSEESDEKEKGFKVDDRRRFTSEGATRSDAGESPQNAGATPSRADPGDEISEEESMLAGTPEDLTFSSFVIGLASQAFVFLGAVPDPQTGIVRKDLPQAQAMIDILSMLGEKTAGNLDEHEARMMEEMLDELRIHYVRELRGGRSEGGKN